MSRESALAQATGKIDATKPVSELPKVAPQAAGVTGDTTGDGAVNATNPDTVEPENLESTRFSAIAKREAKLVKERQEYLAEKAKTEALQKELDAKIQPFRQFEELISKDKLAALKSLGFTDTDIFNLLSNLDAKEPTAAEIAEKAAKAQIDAYKKEQSEKEEKARVENDQRLIQRFKGNIAEIRMKEAEKFPHCAFRGELADAQVFQVVTQVLKDTKEMLTLPEAMQIVEDYYREDFEELGIKFKPKPVEIPGDGNPPGVSQAEVKVMPSPTPAPHSQPASLTSKARATSAAIVNRIENREQKRARLEAWLREGTPPKP